MTQEFNELRALARDRRDKALAEIRQEYEAALLKIASLEQELTRDGRPRYRAMAASVSSVMPTDKPFTTADIMAGLKALDPLRDWRWGGIDWVIGRLKKRGIVRRLKRATSRERAIYIRAEVPIKDGAMEDTTLVAAIGRVLTRPMTTTEVTIAVLESGYRTTMGRNNFRNHVVRQLGRGFKQDGEGKWVG
jgi:hypothetical protein